MDSDKRDGNIGIGLDSCVLPTKFPGIKLIQTVDFFYPLIDNPYWMGKIACANVLSDLYAMGVTSCDNMLMILGISTEMNSEEKKVVVPEMMKGFNELATLAGSTSINGGQTVKNPWLLIGGVATSVVSVEEFIDPRRAQDGDLIVLTKALGTQVVANAHQWMDQKTKEWDTISNVFSSQNILEMYDKAVLQMATLNKIPAMLMHTYKAKACTDVTGFGLIGHAKNLASYQYESVDFIFDKFPVIKHTSEIDKLIGNRFKLLEGTSSETSGGLLICFSKEDAFKFCNELRNIHNFDSWIVGRVVIGNGVASISKECEIIQV